MIRAALIHWSAPLAYVCVFLAIAGFGYLNAEKFSAVLLAFSAPCYSRTDLPFTRPL
jgi:hypothetical protein